MLMASTNSTVTSPVPTLSSITASWCAPYRYSTRAVSALTPASQSALEISPRARIAWKAKTTATTISSRESMLMP